MENNEIFKIGEEALSNLYTFKENGIFRMLSINNWILANKLNYKEVLARERRWNKFNLKASIRSSKNIQFLSVYEEMQKISVYHQKEIFFEQELIEIRKFKNYDFKKYDQFIIEEYSSFVIDYLDHTEVPSHLNIWISNSPPIELKINLADFQHTISYVKYYFNL